MSQAPVSRAAARTGQPAEGLSLGPRRLRLTAVGWVIVATTALALGLRMWQLSSPGHLLGVTEYDDGVYLGAALRLVHGVLPYRDFVLVQPPGLILLMTPVAALAKWTGTAGAMAVGRVLTACAGAAAVPLAGRLVRHRGLLAVLITCGLLAVYPDAIAASVTVLQEPWLVLCCLAGAVAVFDGDQLTCSWKRLAWGGVAFGFAGAIKVWAVIPVLVIVVLAARRPRRAAAFLGGTAAGFLVPVLPFAVAAPGPLLQGRDRGPDRQGGRRAGLGLDPPHLADRAGQPVTRQPPGGADRVDRDPCPGGPGLRRRLDGRAPAAARAGLVRAGDGRPGGSGVHVAGRLLLSLLGFPRAVPRPVPGRCRWPGWWPAWRRLDGGRPGTAGPGGRLPRSPWPR